MSITPSPPSAFDKAPARLAEVPVGRRRLGGEVRGLPAVLSAEALAQAEALAKAWVRGAYRKSESRWDA